MAKWKTVTDVELIKLLSDPRRTRILHLCEHEPKTVKEMAEALGEHPSRLYYHVNKLLEHELLEVADTHQIGNLTEKVYRTIHFGTFYQPDKGLMADHPEFMLGLVHQTLDPGLRMYERILQHAKKLKEEGKDPSTEKTPFHLSTVITSKYQTAGEWMQSINEAVDVLSRDDGEEQGYGPEEELYDEKEKNEKGTYQFILISYRQEDAERLGLLPGWEEESDTSKRKGTGRSPSDG